MTTAETPAEIELGPFILEKVIGQAGMGVVWKGVHREQRVPVAVKVLTTEGSRDPLYLTSLRNEVRGVAALDHPAVVRMYDQGMLPEGVAKQTGGDMVAGSPYMVMEFAEGGTLRPLCGRLGWAQVWRVLLQMLDGLAHAHARGVIHRDIKPSNILLRHVHGGVVLSDFGLARAGDRERGGEALLGVGTPSYMAPEQVRQAWRDIGPWTDLYALGCMACSLVTGRPPFLGETVKDVLDAHLYTPPPSIESGVATPDGFEEWVFDLLNKNHHLRFRRAADAAWALMKLVDEDDRNTQIRLEPIDSPGSAFTEETSELHTLTQSPLSGLDEEDTAVLDPHLKAGARDHPAPGPMPELLPSISLTDRPEVPPLPEDCQTDEHPRRSLHLLGTGLGIFGFRDLPVIGREAEQERLWAAFRETVTEQRGRAVVLRGGPGFGKTHLADWLAQRSHEVGGATVLRSELVGDPDTQDALAPLVHQLMGTVDMDRTATRKRLAAGLAMYGSSHPTELDALVALLGPYGDEQDQGDQDFDRAKARYVLVRRLLQRQAVLRPLMIVLDDAHTSEEAIAFARHVIRAQEYSPHAIQLVMTVGDVDMSDVMREQVDEFCTLSRVTTLPVGPLAPEHRSMLVREMLGLDRALAELVERRSGGNPQFAVQLVGDWVQKGLLQQGEQGFEMRPGITPEFPADLRAIWERRLSAVLPPDRDARSLELAAVLGHDVDPLEWAQACSELGVPPAWDLVDELLGAHLAVSGPVFRSWRFAHGLVAESLIRQARFGGRMTSLHGAAAAMLQERDLEQVAPRLGRHLMGSERLDEAIDVMLKGAEICTRRAEANRAWALLKERESALSRLGVPKSDLRWAEGWLVMAHTGGVRHDLVRAVDMYTRSLHAAQAADDGTSVAARALFGLGRVARVQGRISEARTYLGQSRELAQGNPRVLTNILMQLGSLESNYGDVEVCRLLYDQALESANLCGDPDAMYDVRFHQAGLFRRTDDAEESRIALMQVRAWCLKRGWRERLAQVTNDLAELDRLHGDPEAAVAGYLEAVRLYEAVGATQVYVPRTNLAIMAVDDGRIVEAREHLDLVIPMLQRMGIRGIEGLAHLVLGLVAAHEHNEEECMASLDQGISLLTDTGFVDVDVASVAERLGNAALEDGLLVPARRALELARDHWDILEREEDAARTADLLAEVESLSS